MGKYLENILPYKDYIFTLFLASSDRYAEEKVPIRTGHTVLVVNKETGESQELYSVTEAAKKLNVSRRLLTEYLDRNESLADNNSAGSLFPGFHISRGPANKKISKTAVPIEVVNVQTNETTVYSSITLAGEALGISQISSYFSQN